MFREMGGDSLALAISMYFSFCMYVSVCLYVCALYVEIVNVMSFI